MCGAYLVGLEVVVGGSVDVGRVRVGNPVGVERTTPFVLGAAGTALLVDRIDDPPPVLGGKVDAWFVLLDKARASAQPIRISVDQSHILGLLRVHVDSQRPLPGRQVLKLHRGSPLGRPHRLGGRRRSHSKNNRKRNRKRKRTHNQKKIERFVRDCEIPIIPINRMHKPSEPKLPHCLALSLDSSFKGHVVTSLSLSMVKFCRTTPA